MSAREAFVAAEIQAAFAAMLDEIKWEGADPEEFWVIAGGVMYSGVEGLRAFIEKYGLEEKP